MCGICGFLYFDDKPVDPQLAGRMSDVQKHRGPDESGVHVGRGIALAHRRLSIIDLSTGKQPLSNEDGTVWISFNGEIYNFEDLNRTLAGRHQFRTRSDTETIVHLSEQYPDDFVSMLRGMFAFALWDEPRRTLILARDRVGKKPLYYYLDDKKLVFASEIKSILLPWGSRSEHRRASGQRLRLFRLYSRTKINLQAHPEGSSRALLEDHRPGSPGSLLLGPPVSRGPCSDRIPVD